MGLLVMKNTNKHRVYDIPQLEDLCCQWQKILRLEDWNVRIELQDQVTFQSGKDTHAEITYELNHKKAVIAFPSPGTYASSTCPQQDMLHGLVHELLHLHLANTASERNQTQGTLMEQGINGIAGALVYLDDRGSNHCPDEKDQATG